MAYINVARMFGKARESKSGSTYISILLTIKDVDQFLRSLKKTEYGYQVNGSLFVDREDSEKFNGNFQVKEEYLIERTEDETEQAEAPTEPAPAPVKEDKAPKARKLF